MQNAKRYCITARKQIEEKNDDMIRRIGKSQFDDLEHKYNVKIAAKNLYEIFPADFVLDTLCPILKNMGDKVLISSIITATAKKMRISQHKKKYQAILNYLN